MANTFNWSLGHEGKGNVYNDGAISTWNLDEFDGPHHDEKAAEDGYDYPAWRFYIAPNGGLHDGGIGHRGYTPYTDDQHAADVVSQAPAVWDARNEVSDAYDDPEAWTGGFGHAERLMLSKLASSGWADFHTEFKIPRATRKQIRRWVDRLKWPQNHKKHDAREYHITVLDMEEYDDDFAKWAKKEVQGRELHFKSTGIDMFNDFVVVRLECPEWEDLASKWTEEADRRGLEPHKFPGGPKAHVSVGRSHDRKWPRGIPNPNVKFRTRMFNIKRNGAWHEAAPGDPWQPGVWGKGTYINGTPNIWEVTPPDVLDKESRWHESGADPDFLRSYIEENGPYLFHETGTWDNVHKMLQHGIVPWDSPAAGSLGLPPSPYENMKLQTRPGHTYMRVHRQKGENLPHVRINLEKLNPERIKPDEDFINDGLNATYYADNPQIPTDNWTQRDYNNLGEWADKHNLRHPEMIQRSLNGEPYKRGQGTLAYEGTIPPEALSVGPEGAYGYEQWRLHYLPDWDEAVPLPQEGVTAKIEDTPADDLENWLDSFRSEPAAAISPYHTDHEDFAPFVQAPVAQYPHIDPPKKPYKPYNWAEEGWEESPMNMTASFGQIWKHRTPYYATPNGDYEMGYPGQEHWELDTEESPVSDFEHEQQITDPGFDWHGYQGHVIEHPVHGYSHQMPSAFQMTPEMQQQIEADAKERMEWYKRENPEQFETLEDEEPPHIAHTHMCPQCSAKIDGQICGECGYNPTHPHNEYEKAKNEWYDRAWSRPQDQPREVPHQPLQWGPKDNAADISLISKWRETRSDTILGAMFDGEPVHSVGEDGGWIVGTGDHTWRQTDDLPSVWSGESCRSGSDMGEDRSSLR